jgi:streptogramin lyase
MGLDASGGFIYFVEASAGKIGRLNPNTNEITEWYVSGYWGSPQKGIFVDLSANVWFVSAASLLRLGADNILTYWGTNNEYSHGATVDTKVNIGDVYIGTYSWSYYYLAWTNTDIRRFHPTP